jgi:hypothetical protein
MRIYTRSIVLPLVLSFFLSQWIPANAASSQQLAQIQGITNKISIPGTTPKAGEVLRLNWEFSDQINGGFQLARGQIVNDLYSQKRYEIGEIETAWITRTITLNCWNSTSGSIGKSIALTRVNFLKPFLPVANEKILKEWILGETQTAFDFPVNEKCSEIRVSSRINLTLQAKVVLVMKDNLGNLGLGEVSRYIWLEAKDTFQAKLISVKGVTTSVNKTTPTKKASPTPTPTKKASSAAKPNSPTKAPVKMETCSIFQGQKIYATYGMSEPGFGVTTIKFENRTDCNLDLSIRGDFIGSSNNQQMRCPVAGNWSMSPNSRVVFAMAGTVSGSVPFQTAFPQLTNCFRNVNAQNNFVAVITGASSG